ncbi:MAG: YybH family protein [Thermoguttaceae bacterium]
MCRIGKISAVLLISLAQTVLLSAVEVNSTVKPHPVIDQVFAAYEKAFDAADPKAIGQLWKSDGEFVDPLGNRILGREAVVKLFADFFSRHSGAKLSIKVLTLKVAEPGRVVVAHVLSKVTPPPFGQIGSHTATIVLVRKNDKWLIEGVKQTAHLPASYEHLKDLQWLIGSWTTNVTSDGAGNEKKSLTINADFKWTKNKSFITHSFTGHFGKLNLHGMEVIGWDPKAKTIRSWLFQSNGGFAENTWKSEGKKVAIEHKGVQPDGGLITNQTTISAPDKNTLIYESKNREIGSKKLPDLGPIKFVRVDEEKKD